MRKDNIKGSERPSNVINLRMINRVAFQQFHWGFGS